VKRLFWTKLFSPNQKVDKSVLDSEQTDFFDMKWWEENREAFPQELQDLTDQFLNGQDFGLTSRYWLHLMLKNYKMLSTDGFENYATTISRNYFTWTDFNQAQISNLVSFPIETNSTSQIFKKHAGFSHEESIKHNILIFMLYEAIKKIPFAEKALNEVSDEGFILGNSPFILHDNLTLTLDKLSSISEIIVCKDILSESSLVCEIGGGSGRSADVVLQQFPKTKLIYCDIPPASFIALTRFRLIFPEKVIHVVKDSDNFQMLLSNSESWDILMISPSLLGCIPARYIDLFIAIDCLHEFSNENRAKLAGIIAKVAKYFYTKNWTDTIIPYDEIPLSSNHLSGYYFPKHWEVLQNKPALFPGNFTEILFRVTEIENV